MCEVPSALRASASAFVAKSGQSPSMQSALTGGGEGEDEGGGEGDGEMWGSLGGLYASQPVAELPSSTRVGAIVLGPGWYSLRAAMASAAVVARVV